MKKVILFALTAMFLTSCGKFPDGMSVWADGVFIFPWLTGLAAAFFGWKGYKAHHSSSWIIGPNGERTTRDGGKIPLLKIGWTKFSIALALATLAIIWYQNTQN